MNSISTNSSVEEFWKRLDWLKEISESQDKKTTINELTNLAEVAIQKAQAAVHDDEGSIYLNLSEIVRQIDSFFHIKMSLVRDTCGTFPKWTNFRKNA